MTKQTESPNTDPNTNPNVHPRYSTGRKVAIGAAILAVATPLVAQERHRQNDYIANNVAHEQGNTDQINGIPVPKPHQETFTFDKGETIEQFEQEAFPNDSDKRAQLGDAITQRFGSKLPEGSRLVISDGGDIGMSVEPEVDKYGIDQGVVSDNSKP